MHRSIYSYPSTNLVDPFLFNRYEWHNQHAKNKIKSTLTLSRRSCSCQTTKFYLPFTDDKNIRNWPLPAVWNRLQRRKALEFLGRSSLPPSAQHAWNQYRYTCSKYERSTYIILFLGHSQQRSDVQIVRSQNYIEQRILFNVHKSRIPLVEVHGIGTLIRALFFRLGWSRRRVFVMIAILEHLSMSSASQLRLGQKHKHTFSSTVETTCFT